jgi:hypothetical protein
LVGHGLTLAFDPPPIHAKYRSAFPYPTAAHIPKRFEKTLAYSLLFDGHLFLPIKQEVITGNMDLRR